MKTLSKNGKKFEVLGENIGPYQTTRVLREIPNTSQQVTTHVEEPLWPTGMEMLPCGKLTTYEERKQKGKHEEK